MIFLNKNSVSEAVLILTGMHWSGRILEIINSVYRPGSSGAPSANAKGIGHPGYTAATPYNVSLLLSEGLLYHTLSPPASTTWPSTK